MPNPIIEFLKEKLSFDRKSKVMNNISNEFNEQLSQPFEDYEWVDNMRKRQSDHLKRKY
jgi:hypothetical protein